MTLGCTDACGTATLEGEKILRKVLFSLGPAICSNAEKEEQEFAAMSNEGCYNSNRHSALRCAFRVRESASR
jgi:hypothetical protein